MKRATALFSLAFATAACDSPSAPEVSSASFTFEATGEVRESISGEARVLAVLPNGFTSVDQDGVRTEYSVTPILLADIRSPSAPQLHIGIIGDVTTAEYSVFRGGSERQFYADLSVPRPNGVTRRFSITGGRLTISKVSAETIAGSFTFQSGVYFDWPRDAQPGLTVTGVNTSQSVSGTFVAVRSDSNIF